ncbi:MAG: thioredoxin family protein, partial [Nanoarchaeota archaeon]|nr:thioredoxin family protein [Nanoarchaeota archaeon]
MNKTFLLLMLFLVLPFVIAEETCELEESCAVSYEESIGASDVGDSMAQNPNAICIIYFYTTGCPKCAEIKPFIEGLEKKYGDEINIHKLEVSHNIENYQLYNKYCSVQNIPLEDRGVPMIAVNNKLFMGPSNIEKNLESEIQ